MGFCEKRSRGINKAQEVEPIKNTKDIAKINISLSKEKKRRRSINKDNIGNQP